MKCHSEGLSLVKVLGMEKNFANEKRLDVRQQAQKVHSSAKSNRWFQVPAQVGP